MGNKHWVVSGSLKKWEIHIYKDAVYESSRPNFWAWKIDDQYFDNDEYAVNYLEQRIAEKETGIRMIKHPKREVPDICCGIDGGLDCRHPNICNSVLCSECPIADEFFAKRDGVTLQYPLEEIEHWTSCPECGEMMRNGRCDYPTCEYHWHPLKNNDFRITNDIPDDITNNL